MIVKEIDITEIKLPWFIWTRGNCLLSVGTQKLVITRLHLSRAWKCNSHLSNMSLEGMESVRLRRSWRVAEACLLVVWLESLQRGPGKPLVKGNPSLHWRPPGQWRCQDCGSSTKESCRYEMGPDLRGKLCGTDGRAGEVRLSRPFVAPMSSSFWALNQQDLIFTLLDFGPTYL